MKIAISPFRSALISVPYTNARRQVRFDYTQYYSIIHTPIKYIYIYILYIEKKNHIN